jgi:hypothetical protein
MKKTEKTDEKIGKKIPLLPGECDCTVIIPDIIGWTGEEYRGRKIILMERNPERFGAPGLKSKAVVKLTLHNGIVNHMGIPLDDERLPTPYWAVMDVMSDMKDGFTMEQVVGRAMGILGSDDKMSACKTAWYVLKSHQTHPKERYRGMSFIVETLSPGLFKVRARRADEMQVVFDQGREERMEKRGLKVLENVEAGVKRKRKSGVDEVLVTHVIKEVN